jgi:uncharacterized membrane protein YedE/YeeE
MINAMIGGAIIGIAVSIMLLFNGRVTGISGIISGVLTSKKSDTSWRWAFLLGLLFGGLILKILRPDVFLLSPEVKLSDYIFAGWLVGFGTLMGNGCTSGHGVCGLSRLSLRSLLATCTFIFFGMIGLLLFTWLRG